MSESGSRRYGLPWRGAEVAKAAEAAGVAAFCSGEFVDHEAYSTLAEMALQTEHAQVGPGIAYAFARTPYAHAAGLRGVWSHAPGRVFLGLGAGAYKINRDWFGVEADRPVGRMADLVGAIRAWLHAENGERIQHVGEFYRVDATVAAPVLGRIDAPILIGAFNKLMATIAARSADGVIGHGLFTGPWWDEVVRPATEKGATQAERDARPLEYGWVITAVDDDDPERAIADARRMIAFYLTVKTYDPYVEHHGWVPQVERIREAFAQRDNEAMANAVTDDMLEAIAVCGSTVDARAMLARRGDSLARDIAFLAPPSYLVSPRRGRRYATASLGLISDKETP
ncbi:LLM class flavin-dependent oxidoreductase [Nocardioides sp. cx-173]|uniref:LLM class flavin-dependent oxidoreductase n=1 Tax=Nocardioides sp. cx-173 TaxID=2898796 RepID=UPI001E47C2BE|nr:LLM class flavin-dependent oxidoreductase [Nocardioides sp. cx-173]MCD4524268.1 LLM class flavin-dependent oxidoreductase [Nocardioides sp. cx-173]UGB41660.1 LLM class flavin-dependent oxidoreductase [Nocardioides sp. cx-173]